MAIRDVFWACPLCGRSAGLRGAGKKERCVGCGAQFERGDGASVVARTARQQVSRSMADWLRELGEPEVPPPNPDGVVLGPERVVVRVASEERPLRAGGELLGWIEVYGPRMDGRLLLTTDALRFQTEDGAGFAWPQLTITVVQPSSSALQVATGKMVASIRFPDSSLRLWSRALTTCLRRSHAAQGREITEFQPFLRTRTARTSLEVKP